MHRLALAVALIATPVLAAPADDLGAAVSKATGLPLRRAQEIGTGNVFLELAPRGGMVNGISSSIDGRPAPLPAPNEKRQYQGLVAELGSGKPPVIVERLTFADPDVALEYADMLLDFKNQDRDHPPAMVDVRGTTVVTVRNASRAVAEKAIKAAWSGAPAQAKAPRSLFGFRDEESMGVKGSARGALKSSIDEAVAKSREKFPTSGTQSGLTVTWKDAARNAFAFRTSQGVRVDVDASGQDYRAVQGNDQTIAGLNAELDRLLASTAAAQAAPPPPPPAAAGGFGFGNALGGLSNAMTGSLQASTATGQNGVKLFTKQGQQGFFTADGKPYTGDITQPISR